MTDCRHAPSIVSPTAAAPMNAPTDTTIVAQQLKVRLLYGLFEADASGAVAIGAAILLLVLVAVGRAKRVW